MKRTNFLLGALSGLTIVGNADHIFAKALAASPLPGLSGGVNRTLVLINLQGGNDGLNCVIPHGDAQYYNLRPTIGIPQNQVLAINSEIGLNPMMKSFKDMYDKGLVAIVQGVGYPNPDHSHFRSTEIWQTAAPTEYLHTGWLGRYLDDAKLPENNLFNGVAVSPVLPEVMIADKVDVPAISSENSYGLVSDRNATSRKTYTRIIHDDTFPFSSPYLAHVMEIEDHAQRGSEELPKLINGYKTTASYPATPLGRSLSLTAQIIGSNLGTKVIYIQHGSFDTHVAQVGTQNRLLGEFSDSIKAFYDDLGMHGNNGNVLTMTFSEFGRRLQENAGHGTDHGEGSPLFLIGGGVKGGMYGTSPNLHGNAMGNLAFTTDFRSVYATVLERWLGRPSEKILSGQFLILPVLT